MDLEQFEAIVGKGKELINTLPENTIANRTKKKDFIQKEIDAIQEMHNNVYKELEKRYKKLSDISENEEIELLRKEEEKLSLFKEWNEYNTAYEKMKLDYYLFQLHRYYKEDFNSVTFCLNSIVESFQNVGIILKAEDFYYHSFAQEYMRAVLNKEEGLSDIFETIYWKCPNIIHILEKNFKSIYYANSKKIEKYYTDRKEDFLKNNVEKDIYEAYFQIIAKRKSLEYIDCYKILQQFLNKDFTLADIAVENIKKKKSRIFNEAPVNDIVVLEKLDDSLKEYEIYIKYKSIIDDMKKRIKDKEQYKGKFELKLKEIDKKEKELQAFNSKLVKSEGKKGFFNKIKKDEKLVFKQQELTAELDTLYVDLDNIKFNEIIYDKLSIDTSISEALKMAGSNYIYYMYLRKAQDDKITVKERSEEFREFARTIRSYKFSILNNLFIIDERNIGEIISGRYKLLNVSLGTEQLQEDNLKIVKKDLEDVLFAHNVEKAGLSIDDIEFYLDMSKSNIFE